MQAVRSLGFLSPAASAASNQLLDDMVGHGGAVTATILTLSSSTFAGNEAEGSGGAVALVGQGSATITTCSFVGNSCARGSGGAVFARASRLSLVRASGG